ncbi:NAD(P)-binding protein [Obba rivulosa]|uniref:enoyl-[acyl-carrier-protein] reductase n=1 Tax=Obba rivulosa TaxID=1052685 RepID=A0A8E2DQ53_9APHY|nr:NAD(P)-binding protein [Obba rivulosa]
MIRSWRNLSTLAAFRPCAQYPARSASFSTSSAARANRAIVYTQVGHPAINLRTYTFPTLPLPSPGSVNIRYRLSPINPSDLNVIEGAYPVQPDPDMLLSPDGDLFVPGNEGLAEVTAVGDGVQSLSVGDWIVVAKQQSGTWVSARTVRAEDVVKLPKGDVSEASAATITVNPPTAYNMLREFVDLKEGDWIIQNGANSAVGQAVIQIAARRGINTINLVRNRDDFEELEKRLKALGATHVLTYDDLVARRQFSKQVKEWTEGAPVRLMLNCIGGENVTKMMKVLGLDAHLVTYGAMAREPISIPASPLIFKGLVVRGFWQSRWYETHGRKDREELMRAIINLRLKEPDHEIVTIPGGLDDEEAGQLVRATIRRVSEGTVGKKILWRIEEPAD